MLGHVRCMGCRLGSECRPAPEARGRRGRRRSATRCCGRRAAGRSCAPSAAQAAAACTPPASLHGQSERHRITTPQHGCNASARSCLVGFKRLRISRAPDELVRLCAGVPSGHVGQHMSANPSVCKGSGTQRASVPWRRWASSATSAVAPRRARSGAPVSSIGTRCLGRFTTVALRARAQGLNGGSAREQYRQQACIGIRLERQDVCYDAGLAQTRSSVPQASSDSAWHLMSAGSVASGCAAARVAAHAAAAERTARALWQQQPAMRGSNGAAMGRRAGSMAGTTTLASWSALMTACTSGSPGREQGSACVQQQLICRQETSSLRATPPASRRWEARRSVPRRQPLPPAAAAPRCAATDSVRRPAAAAPAAAPWQPEPSLRPAQCFAASANVMVT